MMMMIAFITFNSSLAPLIEGLCSSLTNPWEFEFSGFRRNHSDDRREFSGFGREFSGFRQNRSDNRDLQLLALTNWATLEREVQRKTDKSETQKSKGKNPICVSYRQTLAVGVWKSVACFTKPIFGNQYCPGIYPRATQEGKTHD